MVSGVEDGERVMSYEQTKVIRRRTINLAFAVVNLVIYGVMFWATYLTVHQEIANPVWSAVIALFGFLFAVGGMVHEHARSTIHNMTN